MKKITFFLLLSLPYLLQGQTARKYQIGLSVNTMDNPMAADGGYFSGTGVSENKLKGYAIGIIGSYFTNEHSAFRLQLVFSNPYKEYYNDDTNAGFSGITTDRFSQSSIKLMPGFRWGLRENKLSFHGGVGLPLSFKGDLAYERVYKIIQVGGPQTYEAIEKSTYPGGFSLGLGFFAGSDYYLTERFHIGFEVGMAYVYSLSKGDVKTSNRLTDANGTITSEKQYSIKDSTIGFTNMTGLMTVAYDFVR